MRGFSDWMCSQVNPMRSSAPGAKFSTITSQVRTSSSSTSLPRGCLLSIVMERLLWFSIVKYRLSTSGMSRSWPRVMSPTPGRSTLMTSAPIQASNCVQVGPDCTCVKSSILTPSRAFIVLLLRRGGPPVAPLPRRRRVLPDYFLLQHALRVEAADVAALAAGRRVDDRIDEGRPPESIAASTARFSSSGLVALTPTPPKASIILS